MTYFANLFSHLKLTRTWFFLSILDRCHDQVKISNSSSCIRTRASSDTNQFCVTRAWESSTFRYLIITTATSASQRFLKYPTMVTSRRCFRLDSRFDAKTRPFIVSRINPTRDSPQHARTRRAPSRRRSKFSECIRMNR